MEGGAGLFRFGVFSNWSSWLCIWSSGAINGAPLCVLICRCMLPFVVKAIPQILPDSNERTNQTPAGVDTITTETPIPVRIPFDLEDKEALLTLEGPFARMHQHMTIQTAGRAEAFPAEPACVLGRIELRSCARDDVVHPAEVH